MNSQNKKYKFLFAGGGTGGHLFPAIAVADKIKSIVPDSEILFIGTKSKIEGRVVPKLGYKFKSIWIKGFARKFSLDNILFPLKLIVSIIQSVVINFKFKPVIAIGTGGYVSGPAIFAAYKTGAKVFLLEQNSFPGITTRILEKYADEIHLSFEDSKKYFKNKNKLFTTGNPIRETLGSITKAEALKKFNLDSNLKTLLILGGSLGADSINKTLAENILLLKGKNLQIIWQTGSEYYETYKKYIDNQIKVVPFLDDMNAAYAACDLLLARAGATTIAEILLLGVPSILVPSPNVAGNHQYFNAKSLSDHEAIILLEDKNLKEKFFDSIISTIFDSEKLFHLKNKSLDLAKPNATTIIAERIIQKAGCA